MQPSSTPPSLSSLVDLLRYRAATQAANPAYIFINDRGEEISQLSFADLEHTALAVARQVAAHTDALDRVLLVFPPGLEFIVGFFGCVLAGTIPVPIMVPRRAATRDSSEAIIDDCAPRLAVTRPDLARLRPELANRFESRKCQWLAIDQTSEASIPGDPTRPPADLAFLQYTSGSTAAPKGVMVTHRNLLANLEMIRLALGNTRSSTYVSWVPLYHDMGLIYNVLQSLYVGSLCVLMAPVTFMQRPLLWLRTIGRYRAEVAGAPNFAYDLCVARFRAEQLRDVDLSCWKVAFNGAEPVRPDTLNRFAQTFQPYGFSSKALYPCYGLAEATLLVSAGRRGDGVVSCGVSRSALQGKGIVIPASSDDSVTLVSCGRSLMGERVSIVDPETRTALEPGVIGEVWVAGPNVAAGYWYNYQATAATFQATLTADPNTQWLRTGDLGFLDEQGELFITGRIKDVIIIRGMNHYPQDIEHTVQNCHPALRQHCGAAFTHRAPSGDEELVLVQEIERTHLRRFSPSELIADIREAVATQHEISAHKIELIRPGSIPKTTSGKIQRALTRELWKQGLLEPVE